MTNLPEERKTKDQILSFCIYCSKIYQKEEIQKDTDTGDQVVLGICDNCNKVAII